MKRLGGDATMDHGDAGNVSWAALRFREQVQSPFIYLALLTVIAVIIVEAIAIEIGPLVAAVIDHPRSEWPVFTKILVEIGEMVQGSGGFVLAFAAVIGGSLLWALPQWSTHGRRFRLFLDHHVLPFMIYREHKSISFMMALNAKVRERMPLNAALMEIGRTPVPWLRAHVQQMIKNQNAGIRSGESLATGLLTLSAVDSLKNLDVTCDVDDHISTVLQSEITKSAERLGKYALRLLYTGMVVVATISGIVYTAVLQTASAL